MGIGNIIHCQCNKGNRQGVSHPDPAMLTQGPAGILIMMAGGRSEIKLARLFYGVILGGLVGREEKRSFCFMGDSHLNKKNTGAFICPRSLRAVTTVQERCDSMQIK